MAIKITLSYQDDSELPTEIHQQASELNLTSEELIKRFIIDGLANYARMGEEQKKPHYKPAYSLEGLLKKNRLVR